jgi:hypothetical protein
MKWAVVLKKALGIFKKVVLLKASSVWNTCDLLSLIGLQLALIVVQPLEGQGTDIVFAWLTRPLAFLFTFTALRPPFSVCLRD